MAESKTQNTSDTKTVTKKTAPGSGNKSTTKTPITGPGGSTTVASSTPQEKGIASKTPSTPASSTPDTPVNQSSQPSSAGNQTPEYTKWVTENGLPPTVVRELSQNKFTSLDDLSTINDQDCKELKLTDEDRGKLWKALQSVVMGKGKAKGGAKSSSKGTKLETGKHPSQDRSANGRSAKSVIKSGTESGLKSIVSAATKLKDGPPAHYKLRTTETARCDELRIRKCEYGAKTACSQEKTLLMIGETGSGKSTMIDAIINHLMGVQFTDEIRFHIIDTFEDEMKVNQSESQTDWITCYTVNPVPGGPVPYTLNIVDTPGFGDTRGMEQDREIVSQIKELFQSSKKHGIETLNAVCYVVKSDTSRLTISQRYIIDSVLAVFGENLKDNIYVMFSFADIDTPSALRALRDGNVPFSEYFTFNNIWMDRSSKDLLGGIYWESGQNNFIEFFQAVRSITPQSLQLSSEVITERQELEDCVEGLKQLISFTAGRLAQMRNTRETLEQQRLMTVQVPVVNITKKSTKHRNVNCPECQNTCKFRLGAMKKLSQKFQSKTKLCKVCNCGMESHVIDKWMFDWEKQTEMKSISQLQESQNKQLTGDGSNEILTVDESIERMKKEEDELVKRVDEQLGNMQEILKKLDEIALRPPSSETGEYITSVMRREEAERKPGYEERLKLMKKLQTMYTLLGDVKTGQVTSATLLNSIAD